MPIQDRRTFLIRAGAAGFALPALGLLACEREEGEEASTTTTIDRPIIVPAGDDLRLLAPAPELPIAYVALNAGRVYVDERFRDEAIAALGATVTGDRWRIPVPAAPGGDEEEEEEDSVPPTENEREAYAAAIREWDPSRDPEIGDYRIIQRRCHTVRYQVNCQPIAGRNPAEWLTAGPWDLGRCIGPSDRACSEVFRVVGSGTRYSDNRCTQRIGNARMLSWFCLEL